jgi:hypothetical protein
MIRGKQEDTVGAVEDRQVVQEEEEEMNTGKEEEEMKKKIYGRHRIERKCEQWSKWSIDSKENKTQKRTRSNNSQAVSTKITPSANSTQAVSTGVADDQKQALTPQIAVRGLIETISMRATTIYNSINNIINKATPIPNRLNINSTDSNNNNNNNINGVDNVIQNEENNNSVNMNSMDNMINIYDDYNISGVDNIIQNGENNLVNNSTANININDNIRNTPGEENSKLESVDSDPLILRPDNSNLGKSQESCTVNSFHAISDLARIFY